MRKREIDDKNDNYIDVHDKKVWGLKIKYFKLMLPRY